MNFVDQMYLTKVSLARGEGKAEENLREQDSELDEGQS